METVKNVAKYMLKDDIKTYELKAVLRCKSVDFVFYDCEIIDYPRRTIIGTDGRVWLILESTHDYILFDESDPLASAWAPLRYKDGYFLIVE